MRLLRCAGWILLALSLGACPTVDPKEVCESDADCFDGYACDLADTQICLRACFNNNDCVEGQVCVTLAGNTRNVCRSEDPTGT